LSLTSLEYFLLDIYALTKLHMSCIVSFFFILFI
jgi:hypothetical protein